MITLPYQSQTITIRQEHNTERAYTHYYDAVEGDMFTINECGIEITDGLDEPVVSCLIKANGGGTAVSSAQVVIDNDAIYLCCGHHVFSMALPSLSLLWKLKADMVTCFAISKLENDLLVHGEMEISRIDKGGNIIWQFSGADIFVSMNGEEACIILPTHIVLVDFEGNRYRVGFDGKLL